MKTRKWSPEALEKRSEGCRVCGRTDRVELAHTTGRANDKARVRGSKTVWVEAESIVPLCGPAVDTGTCHNAYDTHQLDLGAYLHEDEVRRAVEDYGGNEALAMRRLFPVRGREAA